MGVSAHQIWQSCYSYYKPLHVLAAGKLELCKRLANSKSVDLKLLTMFGSGSLPFNKSGASQWRFYAEYRPHMLLYGDIL